jgi:hypothetical protein
MRFNIAVLAASFAASSAIAAPALDQDSFFDPGGYPIQISGFRTNPQASTFRYQAQSVTAGRSGLLSGVDLMVAAGAGTAPLVIRLGHGEVTDVGYASLVGLEIPFASVPNYTQLNGGQFLSVDLSALGFMVSQGDVFTIQLEAGNNGSNTVFGWAFGNDIDGNGTAGAFANYAGGVNRLTQDGGQSWSVTGFDRAFRTYVDAGAVPEPATWAMLITGFGIVGAAARRRPIVTA